MARITTESGAKNTDQLTFQANGTDRIELPSSDFIADANMTRDGDNLILQTPNGEVAVIEGYFSADPAPLLASPDGAVLTPNLVQAFAHSPMEFAANDTASDESPIGAVEEVKGNVTVTRADGTVESVAIGTPIYQGDVVETDANGAVNIVFMDETSMAISENARMAIDEYSYDPATESGTTNFSVLRGLFVFTSGLIGRDDPDDVKIDTPVGSIGIRGTIIAGNIDPNGESSITVLEGAIVVTNGEGDVTLSQAFETVKLNGFDAPISEAIVMPAAAINARFAAVSAVNPSLFSTINEAVQEQQSQQPAPAPTQDIQDMPSTQETAPQSQNAPASNAPAAATQESSAPTQAADAPAPVETVPAIVAIDPSVSGFGSAETGLPSANTIAGQTSGGVFDTSSNSIPVTGGSAAAGTSTASAGTTPVNTTTDSGSTSNAGTTTSPSVADAVQTSPVVINNGGTTTPTIPTTPAGPAMALTTVNATDIAVAGAIVGTVVVSNLAGGTYTYSLSNDPNGYFAIADNGGGSLSVSLTPDGVAALGNSFSLIDLGDVDVIVTPTATGTALTQTLNVNITDANAGRIIDMDINGNGVTRITDSGNFNIGYSISALGDVDSDGFDDFIFTNNISTGSNHSYIVYGGTGGIPTQAVGDGNLGVFGDPIDINGNSVTGTNTGESVAAGVGDLNGDGYRDYVVGQNLLNGQGVVSFHSGSTALWSQNNGATGSNLGVSVSGAGDYNNDGYADVIAGARDDGARLYFGLPAVMPTSPDTLPGTAGGVTDVTGLGDFNGDGYSDFAIAIPGENTGVGAVTIYFGDNSGFNAANSAIINGAGAFGFGNFIAGVGDLNGDGLSDMVVMNAMNSGFIYLGGTIAPTDTANTANATALINIPGNYDIMDMAAAGDFNGDGYADFTISVADGTSAKSYVVFGQNTMVDIDAEYLKNPLNAFELEYSTANNASPNFKVSSIGDVNGDGFDDLGVGVPDANGASTGNGGVIVVNGRSSGNTTVASANNATADGQHLVGTVSNDIFNDQDNDALTMRGGAGNDMFRITNQNFQHIDGGTGQDAIVMNGLNNDINFGSFNFEDISGIEKLAFGANNQTMRLTIDNIFNLLKTSDNGKLFIGNDAGVTGFSLIIDDQTAANHTDDAAGIELALRGVAPGAASVASDEAGYTQFDIGGYSLYIDTTIVTGGTTVV